MDTSETHASEAVRLYEAGLGLSCHDRFEDATDLFERSLRLAPRSTATLLELGTAYQGLLRYDEAIATYKAGLEIAPADGNLHVHLALAQLTLGDYENGWREFEWRWKSTRLNTQRLEFDAPLWDGSDIAGRRLLVYAEQGLGDVIMLARYAKVLAERGIDVIFGCQPPLERLLGRVPGMYCAASRFDQTPPFDLQLPSFALPHVMKARLENIPREVQYLFPDMRRVEAWRQALDPVEGFRVGLAWAGSRQNTNDRNRSVPLWMFAPLAEVEGVSFLSVQKGERAADLCPPTLRLLPTDFDDFVDCASLMANLDLIISVDTATAHLAAALGKPTWTLIPYVPDWRWMLGREDSLWYPTMRLFRQATRGDWSDVLRRVAVALEEMVAPRRGVPF
jgi:Glycosyltransferase family 9 (heptosyltransferase)